MTEEEEEEEKQELLARLAAEEFRRLKGSLTGQALIEALQASPYRDLEIEPVRMQLPVRNVIL